MQTRTVWPACGCGRATAGRGSLQEFARMCEEAPQPACASADSGAPILQKSFRRDGIDLREGQS